MTDALFVNVRLSNVGPRLRGAKQREIMDGALMFQRIDELLNGVFRVFKDGRFADSVRHGKTVVENNDVVRFGSAWQNSAYRRTRKHQNEQRNERHPHE